MATGLTDEKVFENCWERLTKEIIPNLKRGNTSQKIIKKLEKELDSIVIIVQRVRVIDREGIARLVQEIRELLPCILNQHDEMKQKLETLEERVSTLESTLDAQISAHRAEVSTLNATFNARISALEEDNKALKTILLTGQIASCLEKHMVRIILEGTGSGSPKVTFREIERILEGKKSHYLPNILQEKEDRERVEKNWEELNNQYGLDHNFYAWVGELKDERNSFAHRDSKLQLTEAEDRINSSDFLSDTVKEMCWKMLFILNNLKVKNLAY